MRSEVCTIHISTHALTEGDQEGCSHLRQIHISTHALTEGDGASLSWITEAWYFNSRPHGGRRTVHVEGIYSFPFQLTPSRRATNHRRYGSSLEKISTHALTEGDLDSAQCAAAEFVFQLTPSRRATANLDKFFF